MKQVLVIASLLLLAPGAVFPYAGTSTKPPPDPDPDGWQTADQEFEDYLEDYWNGGSSSCECETKTYYYHIEEWGSYGSCIETVCYPAGCGGASENDCP